MTVVAAADGAVADATETGTAAVVAATSIDIWLTRCVAGIVICIVRADPITADHLCAACSTSDVTTGVHQFRGRVQSSWRTLFVNRRASAS